MDKESVIVIVLLVFSMIFTQFLVVASSEPAELLREYEGSIEEIVNLIKEGEEQAAIESLNSLHSAVVETRSNLKGLSFKGKGPKLTDPFTLPKGVYRVHLTTSGTVEVDVCKLNKDEKEMILYPVGGQAEDGASTIYRSNGDKIMIQFSGVMEPPYKLEFEKLG